MDKKDFIIKWPRRKKGVQRERFDTFKEYLPRDRFIVCGNVYQISFLKVIEFQKEAAVLMHIQLQACHNQSLFHSLSSKHAPAELPTSLISANVRMSKAKVKTVLSWAICFSILQVNDKIFISARQKAYSIFFSYFESRMFSTTSQASISFISSSQPQTRNRSVKKLKLRVGFLFYF